jgi:hypothetical protein
MASTSAVGLAACAPGREYAVSSACQALPFELWTVKVVGCMMG